MVREEENATIERRVITERVPPWTARAADPGWCRSESQQGPKPTNVRLPALEKITTPTPRIIFQPEASHAAMPSWPDTPQGRRLLGRAQQTLGEALAPRSFGRRLPRRCCAKQFPQRAPGSAIPAGGTVAGGSGNLLAQVQGGL